MRQLGLVFDRGHVAQTFIATNPELFRPDFAAWLAMNFSLYVAFEREANKIASSGRQHYSANTIIEYMRHETMLRDRNREFKFNDRWTSSMVRLFALMNPVNAQMFEFRERKGGIVAKAAA